MIKNRRSDNKQLTCEHPSADADISQALLTLEDTERR